MDAELIKVADAITRELAAATLSLSFNPIRSYNSETKLEDTDVLHVDVVPVAPTVDIETVHSLSYDCVIDIGIRKRFGAETQVDDSGKVKNEEIDRLIFFEQELIQFLALRALNVYDKAKFLALEMRTAWASEHIREYRQFTSILRITYRVSWELE
jgi:hypothetical protein